MQGEVEARVAGRAESLGEDGLAALGEKVSNAALRLNKPVPGLSVLFIYCYDYYFFSIIDWLID